MWRAVVSVFCLSCAPATEDAIAQCYDYRSAYCDYVDFCGQAPFEACVAAFAARGPCEQTVAVTHKYEFCLLQLESGECATPFVVPPVCNDVLVVGTP